MAAGTPSRYQRDDQRDLDDGDGYSQDEGAERLAHAVGNYFGVMNSCEDGSHQNGSDKNSEEGFGGDLPRQREGHESRNRNHRGPLGAKRAGHGLSPAPEPDPAGIGGDIMQGPVMTTTMAADGPSDNEHPGKRNLPFRFQETTSVTLRKWT
ncbi:hypothetical protein GCM10009589_28440 [Arthrobacter pascens]